MKTLSVKRWQILLETLVNSECYRLKEEFGRLESVWRSDQVNTRSENHSVRASEILEEMQGV